ncbi:actin filament-associated protein 1-like 2 [Thalassophryne amazonica]|uniref:actin filament-associated protein 1-like 2 n=1 Tax=Thalassophryne amazonica TaxID=390379 RepID=UPI001471F0D7|nr:actin filament-associated protein 1-like 2 [Thalassophryne amazonica]
MDKHKALSRLMWDLQSFLSVLDSENLSYIAQAQKKSISELLTKLHPLHPPSNQTTANSTAATTTTAKVEDAEYMIMSCPSSSPKDMTEAPDSEGAQPCELDLKQDSAAWLKNVGPTVALPPGGLGSDDDEDTYEEAEPFIPDTATTNTEKGESDSSHYESYGEDDEDGEGEELVKDRAHYIQWSASQPCLRPALESRLCGYLWRRKWLGQWTKQLFIIRNDVLLCYKCAQDLLPQLELNLLCQLVYKAKNNRKIQHQLKLLLLGADTLVLGYGSFQQAEEWRRVIEEGVPEGTWFTPVVRVQSGRNSRCPAWTLNPEKTREFLLDVTETVEKQELTKLTWEQFHLHTSPSAAREIEVNCRPLLGPTVALPPGGLGSDDDEDTYEEAEPFIPDTALQTQKGESDSSHYESYGEDDEDVPSQPCLRPALESRLCGYLWRRKWLGQWTKQLFIIRNDVLLCYKCAQDLLPQLELNLLGCQLVYKAKNNRKIQHQLKLLLLGADTLVLGYGSFQQAEEWRRVIEEVSAGGDVVHAGGSCPVRAEQSLSCVSSVIQMNEDEDKPSAACSRKKNHKGFLNVLMNCQWQNLLCQVEDDLLKMFGDDRKEEESDKVKKDHSPQYSVPLRGCEVQAGPDTDSSFRITLSLLGDPVAVLETSTSEEKQRWLQLLQDEAANHGHCDDTTGGALRLQTRRFPADNTYMDDPFHLVQNQPIYSNMSILDHMIHGTQDPDVTYGNTVFSSRKQGVQKLELTGKERVPLRAGSEVNLASAGKPNKRMSFRQSLAVCTERAQAGFLNPLLRRTASAKTSLRKAPSALFIENGKVFQSRKEWETKAAF